VYTSEENPVRLCALRVCEYTELFSLILVIGNCQTELQVFFLFLLITPLSLSVFLLFFSHATAAAAAAAAAVFPRCSDPPAECKTLPSNRACDAIFLY
jgi:hypothetical protein